MQGIGQVFGEHIAYDPDTGQLLSGTFMDYFMPRAENLPPIALIDCGVPSPVNPLGAKGRGRGRRHRFGPGAGQCGARCAEAAQRAQDRDAVHAARIWRAIHRRG